MTFGHAYRLRYRRLTATLTATGRQVRTTVVFCDPIRRAGVVVLKCLKLRKRDARRDYPKLTTSHKQRIHLRCRVVLQLGDHVAVRVHRHTDLAVPQDLHHDARMDALC